MKRKTFPLCRAITGEGNMQLQISDMLERGYLDDIETVKQLKKSTYYNLLINAFDELQTERLYKSLIHGIGHVERVMLLGSIIAMQQSFSARETELLLIACSYHDIGRIDDRRDDQHGKRSADMLASIPGLEISMEELRSIQAAVATHSTQDAMIDAFAEEYRVPDECLDLCRTLCKGLKDADNLDRVRIGDLDIRHLRFDESKKLKPVAEAFFRLLRNFP